MTYFYLFIREDEYLCKVPVSILYSGYQREGYIKSMADLIEKELQRFPEPKEVDLLVLYFY